MCIRDRPYSNVMNNANVVTAISFKNAPGILAASKVLICIHQDPMHQTALRLSAAGACGPVSYTHLDVYKTQPKGSISILKTIACPA